MPNQEDYLDNLLKEVTDELEMEDGMKMPKSSDLDNLYLNDSDTILHSLGEDDLDELLRANQEAAETEDSSAPFSHQDSSGDDALMSLLQESDESDLQEIHTLLQKSDNNESIADEIREESEPIPDIIREMENEGAPVPDKNEKAEEKKRLKEAKREEKRLAKEAKKAEAEAKKAAKKAEAEAKRAAKKAEKSKPSTPENFDDMDALLNAAGDKNILVPDENEHKQEEEEDIFKEAASVVEDVSEMFSEPSLLADMIPDEEPKAESAMAEDSMEADLDISSMDIGGTSFADEPSSIEAASASGEMEGKSFSEDDGEEKDSNDLLESLEQLQGEKSPKKGFFAKFLDFIFEEDEDEEEEEKGNEDVQLSEENQAILEDMDKEKGKKKGKKGKKGKKVKGAEAAEGAEAEGDEDSEGDAKGKGKKPKKAKKPKKEKESEPVEPGKKLSKKRIFLIVLVCATLTAVILILTNVSGEYSTKRSGRKAYYAGDYQTCYQELHGKNLTESEQVMYNKSECILKIRLWMKEYELLASEGDEVKALDNLIQSINSYQDLYEFASKWNAANEVAEVHNQMVAILSDKYHLTLEEALAIAAEPDDIAYTKQVTAVAQGGSPDSYGTVGSQENDSPLKDVLPEEEGLNGSGFIDNNR